MRPAVPRASLVHGRLIAGLPHHQRHDQSLTRRGKPLKVHAPPRISPNPITAVTPGSAAAAPSTPAAAAAGPPAACWWRILLLPANLVGHLRLVLTIAAVATGAAARHPLSVALFCSAFALDFVDGWLARALNQSTAFGDIYDIALDLGARSVLWTWGARTPAAIVPVLLESFTFVATHAQAAALGAGAPHWKDVPAPPWVRRVLSNGLRNPLGAWAVLGLYGCPLWLYLRRGAPDHWVLAAAAAPAWGWLVIPGRLLAAAVEVYLVGSYARRLMQQDAAQLAARGKSG